MSKPPPLPEQLNISAKAIVTIVAIAGILGTIWSMVYQVPTDSVAVVLRFGKLQLPLKGPGLQFRLPFGIDQVRLVERERQKKMEFGFQTSGNTNSYQYSSAREQQMERDLVTGDLNLVSLKWVVQYRITEPEKYLFDVRDPEPTLRNATESVMREVVGDRTVDEVLTVGRAEIEQEAFEGLKKLVTLYSMGLDITQIQLKEVNPPEALDKAFQDVTRAGKEKETKMNQANREYLSTVPQVRGKAEREIREAEGYAAERINKAQGDASRFKALFTEYQKAPEVTKRRIYLETMQEVVPSLGTKIVIDEDAKQLLPLLNLNK